MIAVDELFATDRIRASLWFEPAFIVIILAASLAVTPPPGLAADWGQLQNLVGWYLAPLLGVHFAVLGIVGGLVIAVAVMTGFGSKDTTTDARYRTILELILTVSSLLLLFMAACAVRVAIHDWARWPEVVVALVGTWIIALTARVALGERGVQLQAAVAQRDWVRRRARARDYGISRRDKPRATVRSLVLACVVPALPYTTLASVVATMPYGDDDPWPRTALVLFSIGAYLGHLILSVTWHLNRDISNSRFARALPIIVGAVLALLISCTCVVPLMTLSGAPLYVRASGCATLVFVILHAAFLASPRVRRRVRWFREAEDAATVRSLRKYRKNAKRLMM